MPAHTSLKERMRGQGDLAEQSQIDFRRELLEREAAIAGKKRLRNDELRQVAALQDEEEIYDDGINDSEGLQVIDTMLPETGTI